MKGVKGSTDEGGVRVPCFVRWAGRIRPNTIIRPIAGAIDLLPTLADMAGIPLVGKQPLDGKSLKPLLLGATTEMPDRMIFTHQRGRVSVRTQRYRLDHQGRLYDMVADPGQHQDVSAEHPEAAKRLREAVARWRAEALVEIAKDDRPFPVGYRQFPTTFLPARDGVPHGGVKRSAKAPNCSFFTNWRSTEDSMTWDVEVATEGEYEVRLMYTCPPADVGSTVELSFGEARLQAKLTTPHHPPLVGAEFDRYPRKSESYVKDFRPFVMGTVRLPRGRDALTLRAVEVPGTRVMDVRGVELALR